MTDTQDQLDVLPPTGAASTAAGSSTEGQSAAANRAKRRSGSLSAMLLPELQALAGSLGIPTAKLRKSELISAIESSGRRQPQVENPPVRAARAAATNETSVTAPAPTTSSSAQAAPAPVEAPVAKTRIRRSASRPAGPAQAGDDTQPAAAAPAQQRITGLDSDEAPARPDTSGDATSQRPPRDRQNGRQNREERLDGPQGERVNERPDDREAAGSGRPTAGERADRAGGNERTATDRNGGRNNGDRNNGDRNNGDRNNGDRGANDRTGNDRAERTQNRTEQNRNNQNGGQSGNRNTNDRNTNDRNTNDRNTNDRNGEDDDEFGSRRGRRYRDRRGRNRERFEGNSAGGGRQDAEPTVHDDDVLVPVAGILDEVADKNTWFIRTAGYFASSDDVYVANSHIRRYGLRRGDAVTGVIKAAREGERKEKFNPLVRLDSVNGLDPETAKNRVEFTKLTPLYPQDRLRLETEPNILTTRVIDLVMPIGKGQRALIVSPPKAGKTSVLQAIANAIAVNNPECHLMVVLVDERPEEVTDMQRSVKGEVIASTFDRRPQDHTMVAELSIERAKRLTEMGHDVVVLLDSITRLGRAYNLAAPASGRILSGGVDSTALYPPKRFLGAARNIENGGSLTILATALVETGSTMDTVIFEEFKGTGNAELILDRKIADKRVFPAVNVDTSGTRKEEILMSPDELAVVLKLRRVLHSLEPQQGIDLLLDRLKKTRTNIEFLMQIAKTAPGGDER